MGRVKVKEVYEKYPDSVDPILLRFQHAEGSRQSSQVDLNDHFRTAVFHSDPAKLGAKDFSHLNSSRNGHDSSISSTVNRKRQLVALQNESMTYLGSSNDEEEQLRTYIALKKGKKLRVYEVTPITVAPFIKGHSFVTEKERESQEKKSREEKKAAAIDLVKSFGSKKKRLTYERLEKNKIDISDMNESMNKASAQIKAAEEEPKIKDESVLTLIPPCDRSASTPSDVYNLDDILTPEEMDELEKLAQEFYDLPQEMINKWKVEKKFSDYFIAMWNKLHNLRKDAANIRRTKLVLYAELLIAFLKLRADAFRKKSIDLPEIFPQWLKEKALDEFTIKNAKGMRNRPAALTDKTACYILVLVLLANDFVLDMQLMSTTLNFHIKKLLTLAKAVGVTLTYNNVTKENRGVLKLPLPKPIETRGRRRALR